MLVVSPAEGIRPHPKNGYPGFDTKLNLIIKASTKDMDYPFIVITLRSTLEW